MEASYCCSVSAVGKSTFAKTVIAVAAFLSPDWINPIRDEITGTRIICSGVKK